MKKRETLLLAAFVYVQVISFLRMYEQNRVIDFLIVNAALALGAATYAALEVVGNE
tara:strand:+ start:41 stop:208 length:168 start_codon:yes stop_codon:yes gene_type:complete